MKRNQKSEFLSSRVQYIPLRMIRPNPQQPRRNFSQEGLAQLSDSIRQYGIIQPLTVRKCEGYYELVAGERRARAARMAGLKEVPCLTAQIDEKDAGLLALIENLHRRDLNCFEEAEAIARMIRRYDMSQQEAAEKLGKSQSAIANKLRLLRLDKDLQETVLRENLTERHARALLRLTDGELQRQAVKAFAHRKMNVAQAEEYVEELLRTAQTQPPRQRTAYVIKDVRLFLNSIRRQLEMMNRSGVGADMGRQDTAEAIFLTIRIPKNTGRKVGCNLPEREV